MEIKLTDLTVPTFLWYILPGVNVIAVDVLFPMLLLEPQQLTKLESLGGVVLLGVAALAIGFIMDSFKLYQLSWQYKSIHDSFFVDLGNKLDVSTERAHIAFGAFRILIQEKGPLGESVVFDHARWVMINLTSKCFYVLAVIWAFVTYGILAQSFQPFFMKHLGLTQSGAAIISSSVIVGAMLAALRLARVSRYHRAITRERYLHCAESYQAELLEELKLMKERGISIG